jgi:DNA-3-methyladenine glycosylase I
MSEPKRCHWVTSDPLYIAYHDEEWGVPRHNDRALFELLILEGAQAGLSWITILKKRPAYREAFDHFDPEKVARYGDAKMAELLANTGIVRNRLKVHSAVTNARAFLRVQQEFGTFDSYLWRFVDGQPLETSRREGEPLPARTKESEALSKDLVKREFKFAGPAICYAFMQASGMVNDHLVSCFRWRQVTQPLKSAFN